MSSFGNSTLAGGLLVLAGYAVAPVVKHVSEVMVERRREKAATRNRLENKRMRAASHLWHVATNARRMLEVDRADIERSDYREALREALNDVRLTFPGPKRRERAVRERAQTLIADIESAAGADERGRASVEAPAKSTTDDYDATMFDYETAQEKAGEAAFAVSLDAVRASEHAYREAVLAETGEAIGLHRP